MAIKLNQTNGTYEVSYCKRHPITRQPHSGRRIGIKTKAEANRILAELIVQIDRKIHESVVPAWEPFVALFLNHCRNRGLTEKTVYDYGVCLKAYTYEPWGKRLIDSITTDEIRALMKGTEGKSTS